MKKKYSSSESRLLKLIGENIRKTRKKARISQEGLALECGVDRSYMGRIERGNHNFTVLTLKKIADTLKVDVADFFKLRGK